MQVSVVPLKFQQHAHGDGRTTEQEAARQGLGLSLDDTAQGQRTAVFMTVLRLLDAEINRRMARDDMPGSSFARAYVDLILDERKGGATGVAKAQTRLMLMQPSLYAMWSNWLMEKLAANLDKKHASQLNMVHHAAVGVWLGIFLTDSTEMVDEDKLRRRMLGLLPW